MVHLSIVKIPDTDAMRKELVKELTTVFALASRIESSYLKTERLTGGTSPTKLGTRTGALRASVRPISVNRSSIVNIDNVIQSGVSFGTRYAKTHIGRRGTVTTIRPKGHPYLAIPLPAARTRAGVAKGQPEVSWQGEQRPNSPFGDTFIAKSKRGNLIIFGKTIQTKGVNWGRTKGKVIPLFVLKHEVKIPVRIPIEGIYERLEDTIKEKMKGLVQ